MLVEQAHDLISAHTTDDRALFLYASGAFNRLLGIDPQVSAGGRGCVKGFRLVVGGGGRREGGEGRGVVSGIGGLGSSFCIFCRCGCWAQGDPASWMGLPLLALFAGRSILLAAEKKRISRRAAACPRVESITSFT